MVCFVHIRDMKRLRGHHTCDAILLAANVFLGVIVIPCLEVSLLLTFTGSSVSRTVLLELLLTTCEKDSSMVAYQGSLCFQDGLIGVQVPTKWLS